ncbi:hypothetical protein LX36DRAFT_660306 [Colletotrichum falcatum]|nr:hypothetical protein LX36DRAFT_660306 [Colletotrichum falcatum]
MKGGLKRSVPRKPHRRSVRWAYSISCIIFYGQSILIETLPLDIDGVALSQTSSSNPLLRQQSSISEGCV